MITIPPTESLQGFAIPVFFERTERYKERVIDCTREELIDLVFVQMGYLESVQGNLEAMNLNMEKFLGYQEPMFKINNDGQRV